MPDFDSDLINHKYLKKITLASRCGRTTLSSGEIGGQIAVAKNQHSHNLD